MSKGILQVHPPICDCPGCRISSPVNRGRLADKRTVALPPARALKKELTPSFSASDGDSDGSGPACGQRPGLKQEDDPRVRIMKRRVHTHWDVNISFRETSCSQDSDLPTLISSLHRSSHLGPAGGGCGSCEEPQWPGSPPALIHARSTSEAGPRAAPRGPHSSWHPIFLREGAVTAGPLAVVPECPAHRPGPPPQASLFGGALGSVPDPRFRLPAPCPGGDARPAAGAPAEAEPGPAGAVGGAAASQGTGERTPAAAAGAGGHAAPAQRRRGAAAARGPAGAETQLRAGAGSAATGTAGPRAPHPAPGALPPSPSKGGLQPCLSPAQ
ncbi:sterile alpha motif domain containing 11 [Phyllostomus discolor]|uniref:Sterile alpha motif domain containing 11 n=1 Tax=Phyllostomus discolor TaxID=89673 RepID=A0A834EBQ9_9CHIR|nr:sterile alpha motif domain containing 11 [Phyllostomus discolor]